MGAPHIPTTPRSPLHAPIGGQVITKSREQLLSWVGRTLDGATCSPGLGPGATDADVLVWFLGFNEHPQSHAPQDRDPVRFGVRFLVLTQGADAEERLDALMAAAIRDDAFEVDLSPLDPRWWLALGAPPQASFVVEVEAQVERARTPAPSVRSPLGLEMRATRPLHGAVLGPDRTPIAGARIEILGLGLITVANGRGQFEFPAIPDGSAVKLRISARGQEFFAASDLAPAGESLIVNCDVLED